MKLEELSNQQEARFTEMVALQENHAKWKEEANTLQQKCKDFEQRLQEVGPSA